MRNARLKIESPPVAIIYGIFTVMAGLLLPVLLIPVVKFTGYSEIVEEIAKGLVVLFLILNLPTHKLQILGGIAFGFLFGVSENFFISTRFSNLVILVFLHKDFYGRCQCTLLRFW